MSNIERCPDCDLELEVIFSGKNNEEKTQINWVEFKVCNRCVKFVSKQNVDYEVVKRESCGKITGILIGDPSCSNEDFRKEEASALKLLEALG